MRSDQPNPRVVRRRLDRLDRLPIRPTTARRLVASALDRPSRASPGNPTPEADLDPGLVLDSLRGKASPDPLRPVEDLPWWVASACDDARETLWRHSVALSLAARRLASESGREDIEALSRLGLLADLGAWALAAVAPTALAHLLAIADPRERRDRTRVLLGHDMPALGRDLADRWGMPPDLADAAWLAPLPDRSLATCADSPERLALLQRAYALAESTPWRLGPVDAPDDPAVPEPDEPLRRWLIDEVRVRCAGPLIEPEGSGLSRAGCRRVARLLRRDARARADRARLDRRLGDVVEAHRDALRRAEADAVRGRIDALAEFAAGAGHELNNPLAVVQGRAQLLLARTSDPEAVRSLRAIIAQAQRAHRLIRDLMYVARPPAARSRPCQPFELARAALRDVMAEAESRGVAFTLESDDPGSRVWADPDAIRHLVESLARNALEATPPGGSIRVVGRAEPDRLLWEFHDTGRGLDAASAAHLFDPFYSGRQAGRGLGLGLTRVARHLAQLGGKIAWRPAAGGGTIFNVVVPLASRPDDAPDVPARSA